MNDDEEARRLIAERNEVRLLIQNLISEHDDKLFEKFDQLHKRGIHDNDVKDALTELHYTDLLDGYEDWMHDGEPVRADEDGPLDQGEQLVTDPGNASSYSGLAPAGGGVHRIDHGIFFAEQSNDGVHWHVYKKRSHEDNGAFIATANDRAGAEFILHSLGTGTIEGN